jgi:Cd2+/Zn2+-exporting ATPase
VKVEDTIVSGCINISGLLKVRVTKSYGESTVSKIINLVENASENKSKSETFIAKFSRIYTPVVVFVAITLAVLPPLFSADFMGAFPTWLYRALTFLIVSCPCALVISVPLTFFGGIGGAGKKGILIKGGNYVETLSKLGTIVFDKTGTLTKGKFEVSAVHPDKINENQLLHLAAHVERFSTHPIAISLKNAYPNENDDCKVEDIEEVSGQGIHARVNGDLVCVGNTKMMDAVGAKWKACEKNGTIIHVAVNGTYAGHIVISDTVKDDSKDAISALKAKGVEKTVMLTGDRKEVGEAVARELGLDEYYAELLPADKVKYLERILSEKKKGTNLAFVGDGINDAPVLARADVGIAMGGLGSDAAIEAADVVLMDDKPSKIAVAIGIARRTINIARQNVAFAIFIKVLVLVLAGIGIATMWMAVFADVGVTVIAILNATRALKV